MSPGPGVGTVAFRGQYVPSVVSAIRTVLGVGVD
jgi:hypothetical protein